jgi:prepilin-type N-terminal cleavage/methylation domain-containing protein
MADLDTTRIAASPQAGPERSEGPGHSTAARRATHPLPHHPHGLTLIEVVAAIAILGTLLVGITLSQSRHTRQLAAAEKQTAAARAADELIAGWWTTDAGVPVEESGGFVADGRSYAWVTRLRENPELARWGARVVRVTVGPVADQNSGESGGLSGGLSGRKGGVTVSEVPEAHRLHVDLVLPDPEWQPRTARRDATEEEDNAESVGVERSERGEGVDDTARPDETDSPDDRTRWGTQGGARDEAEQGEDATDESRGGREYPADQSDRWFERREKR